MHRNSSYDAAIPAAQLRTRLLLDGSSFGFETVFSHPSKNDSIALAKTIGYSIILVFIHQDDASLNQARLAQRVREGGHDVPDEKIINRIPRVLKYIRQVIPLCDRIYILDNSRADNSFQQLAAMRNG
jgi:predicted ABC-type ATPase